MIAHLPLVVVLATSPVPLDHVAHAVSAERDGVTAEVMLAVAWVETRFHADAVSRLQGGRRVVGRWRSTSPAGRGPRYCGVMQTRAGRSWSRCLEQRDLQVGYELGAAELAYWLRRCRGKLRCALAGHGGGNASARRGTSSYATAVLRRLRATRAP